MSLLLQIDENPNCASLDAMIWQPRGDERPIRQLRYERSGEAVWCDITGVEEGGHWTPALAVPIDDSGEGACFLVYGGAWGLRLKERSSARWDLASNDQWGVTYLLVGGDGADLRFA